ncbi:MAG TPA: DNA-binding protein [Bacteroidales bacterium]|nr:DNA-binding protein [Bacteroidales bacterium]
MDGFLPNDEVNREEIFSKSVRAGKRTYFFDVKKTRNNELYLTITESKKRLDEQGNYFFEKHKLFLYKEDFEKFMDALNETANFIYDAEESGSFEVASVVGEELETIAEANFTAIEFEDLER